MHFPPRRTITLGIPGFTFVIPSSLCRSHRRLCVTGGHRLTASADECSAWMAGAALGRQTYHNSRTAMRRRICPLYEWLPNARARRSVCGAEDGRPLVHARGGNRTRTPRKGKGILSPSRLPFRHPGQCRTRPYEQHRDTGEPPHVPVIVSVESWRAGNGTRTRDPNLGKVVLYQLSYSRSRPKPSRSSASEQEDAPGTLRPARPSITAMPTLEYSCCTVR